MISKIKIRYYILLLLILMTVVKAGKLAVIVGSLFTGGYGYFSRAVFDNLVSVILIVIFAVTLLFSKKNKILNLHLSLSSALLILLFFFAVFAPVISTFPPDQHNDISVAKLLPPFSSKEQLIIREKTNNTGENSIGDKKEFIADKIVLNKNIILYRHNKADTVQSKLYVTNKAEINSLFFLFGTDEYGRDIFSRIVYGTRLSLFIGLASVVISLLIGISLGFLSGYSGKFMDNSLNRFTEMFLAFPVIFLIILLLALFGNSIWVVIIVLGFSGWMSLFKIVRGEVISVKNKDFVLSAGLLGYTNSQILRKEIMPGMITPVLVNLIFLFGNVIIAESALSFLGLGISQSYPTWGGMISQGQYFLSVAWWISFFPCLFLSITLISANKLARNFEQNFQLIAVR